MTDEPLTFNVPQTGKVLNLSPSMVRKLETQGKLHRVPNCGRRVIFSRFELERFANGRAS